jgi:hypothetical protein
MDLHVCIDDGGKPYLGHSGEYHEKTGGPYFQSLPLWEVVERIRHSPIVSDRARCPTMSQLAHRVRTYHIEQRGRNRGTSGHRLKVSGVHSRDIEVARSILPGTDSWRRLMARRMRSAADGLLWTWSRSSAFTCHADLVARHARAVRRQATPPASRQA